jgi:putative PEP-CTERM system TPR-repeat lipoprotein
MKRSWQRYVLLGCIGLLALGCDNKTVAEHVQSAQEAIGKGELRVAVIELKNAIQKDANAGNARSLLGQVHYALGDLPSSLKELERAVDLGQQDDATRLALLKTKNSMGRYSEVIGELEEESNLTPEYAVVLADAYFDASDIPRAKLLYEQGLHLPDGLFGMARVAQIENDIERALSYLRQVVEKQPAHRDGWLYKGELELGQNDHAAALASFERAAALPGGNISGKLGVVRALLVAEELDKAQAEIDAMLASTKEFPPANYLKGLISFRQGDLEGAEASLRVVQQFARDHPPTLYLMGAVKAQQGQFNQAEDQLRRYLAQDADNVSVRKLLASVYNEQNKSADVIKTLQGIAEQNSDPQIWAMLGAAQMRLGNMADATAALERAVELAPDMAPFRNQLALSLLSAGQDERAVAELGSAVELDSDQFQSDYILVMVKLRDGDLDGASEAVEKVIAKSADVPIGYNLKGGIALAKKDREGAVAAFEKALALDPAFFPAAQNLARLAEQDKDPAAAIAIYESVLQASGEAGNEAADLAIVDLVVRQGNLEEGLQRLNKAVADYPGSVRARLGQLRLLLASGQLDNAEKAADDAAKVFADVPDILLLKADIDLRTGDRNEAQRTAARLQTMLDQYKGNPQLLAAAGALQLRLGNLTIARQNLELALKSDQAPVGAVVSMARLEIADGDPASAKSIISQLQAQGVKGEQIELLMGDVMLASNDMDQAFEHFKKMAANGSRLGTSNYILTAVNKGEADLAEQVAKDWLSANPSDVGMQLMLANVQIQTGKTASAKAQYESMLPTDDPVVLNNLAWIYMGEGSERAIDMARQANAAAPDNPDIEDTLGWILVQNGSVQEGLDLLRSSARARPDNAEVQYHLGVAYMRANNSDSARSALRRAVELGGFADVAEAKKLLETL